MSNSRSACSGEFRPENKVCTTNFRFCFPRRWRFAAVSSRSQSAQYSGCGRFSPLLDADAAADAPGLCSEPWGVTALGAAPANEMGNWRSRLGLAACDAKSSHAAVGRCASLGSAIGQTRLTPLLRACSRRGGPSASDSSEDDGKRRFIARPVLSY